MKQLQKILVFLLLLAIGHEANAQNNLLSNGGFEGIIQSGDYPRLGEILHDRCAAGWFSYNSSGDARWFMDTIWVPTGNNSTDPLYQTGYFKTGDFNSSVPWGGPGSATDTMLRLPAHHGLFYVGFDAQTDGPVREGVQAKVSNCGLNSGTYNAEVFYARAYGSAVTSRIFISLSDHFNTRRRIVDDFTFFHPMNNTGEWNRHQGTFTIIGNDLADFQDEWFAITGQSFGDSDPRNYVFIDDVRLYRPCDVVLHCVKAHGQICPTVATQQWPNHLLSVQGIDNASELHLKISSLSGAIVFDSTYHNGNGLPDYYLSRFALPVALGIANYNYDLELSNSCGAFKKSGHIQVYDTSYYAASPVWRDTAANWSVTPIPCCLSTLTLQNLQIVGDVSYIVRDEITVQGGVSVALGSHVVIQAGNVVELDSVEFDGSVSTVEILEVPCPQRLACGGDCEGGPTAMTIDGAGIHPVLPVVGDVIATVGSNVAALQAKAPTMLIPKATEAVAASQSVQFSVSPNPFEDRLSVRLLMPSKSTCSLVLMDLQMRPVKTIFSRVDFPSGLQQFDVDVQQLPAGVYFLQLVVNGGAFTKKMVKQ